MICMSFDRMDERITYDDVKEYERLFTLAPLFLLERFARKNSNLVLRFKSAVQSYMDNLTDEQRNKLNVVLNSPVEDLQGIMHEAYLKTGIKQYNVLANPKYRQFIEDNFGELRKML